VLGVEKPSKPQKAEGEGRQRPPEGSPCGLGSSSCSPVGQRASQPQVLPCTPASSCWITQAGCSCWRERCQGNLLPRHQGKAWAEGPGQGECMWCEWERLQLGGGRSWTGQRGVGPGWAVPLSLVPCGGGLWGGVEGGMESSRTSSDLLHTSPLLRLGRMRCLGQALVSCQGALGIDLIFPRPLKPLFSALDTTILAQGTCRRQSVKIEELARSLCCCRPQHPPWCPSCCLWHPLRDSVLGRFYLSQPHIPLHIQSASLYFSQATCPCFHLLYTSFLLLSLVKRSLIIHAGLLIFMSNFLLSGMAYSSCWRECFLNINQHSWIPLSSRALSYRISHLFSISFKSPKL